MTAQVKARVDHRGSQHSFLKGVVRTFDLFVAEAKGIGFITIKYVLWPMHKAKITASLRVSLTLA